MPTTLWPELPTGTQSPRGVRRILQDAGSGLADQSDGVLRLVVQPVQTGKDSFRYTCVVMPTTPTNVAVELCAVETGLTAFPADLYTPDGIQVQGIRDEEQLLAHLAKVFQSERTKEVLVNLIANFS